MNLPNTITIARILAIPIFLIILNMDIEYKNIISAGVFILISATDALDGYLARKQKKITAFGKFADPLADKLLVAAALIYLIGFGVPKWVAFVIIAREIAVTGLRLVASTKKIRVAASNIGKIKTITQIIALIAVILGLQFSYYALLVAVVFSLWSGIDYFIKLRGIFKNEI